MSIVVCGGLSCSIYSYIFCIAGLARLPRWIHLVGFVLICRHLNVHRDSSFRWFVCLLFCCWLACVAVVEHVKSCCDKTIANSNLTPTTDPQTHTGTHLQTDTLGCQQNRSHIGSHHWFYQFSLFCPNSGLFNWLDSLSLDRTLSHLNKMNWIVDWTWCTRCVCMCVCEYVSASTQLQPSSCLSCEHFIFACQEYVNCSRQRLKSRGLS